MNDDWFEQRMSDLIRLTKNSNNENQFNHRKKILERINKYIEESRNQEEFQKLLLPDYPCFASIHFTANNGLPFMPSPWETQFTQNIIENERICTFTTRRGGKSATLAGAITYLSLLKNNWKSIIFAPTKRQLFVFSDIKTIFENNPYLCDFFLSGNNTKIVAQEIFLNNGSKIVSRTVGLIQKGKTSRGESTNLLAVDEFQLVDRDTFESVILPIIKDTYTKKKLVLVGTPSQLYNNQLENWWNDWQQGDDWATLNVDCWEVCDEGGMSRKYIMESQNKYSPDKFMREYLAKFPHQTGRPYPLDILQNCGKEYSFLERGIKGAKYLMAIDIGQKHDRTQIIVAEIIQGILKIVHWKEMEMDSRGIKTWKQQSDTIKDIYHRFYPEQIIMDVTSNQDMLLSMVTDGENMVPPAAFWMDKGKKYRGYIADNRKNWDIHLQNQRLIRGNKMVVPTKGVLESKFFRTWVKEHNELTKKEQSGTQKLVEPKNGYKDLAVASMMLSYLFSERINTCPPSSHIGWW